MGVETKYQKNGQSLEDWQPDADVSEGTREEKNFRRGKEKAFANTRGRDLKDRYKQVDDGFKEMRDARERGGGRHATDHRETSREFGHYFSDKGMLVDPQSISKKLGYEKGGKVQKSSSRRKEEGLDTEIVVEPKKYAKGGKVKC